MKTTCVIILTALLTSVSMASESKNTFVSKDLGISIDVPVSKAEAPVHQVAMFFLPASDGFAANVNIQKQKYSESIEVYDKLSVNQFKSMSLTVVSRKKQGDEVVYEYKGDGQGRELHWYSKAIKKGSHVYLVTATGLESRWKEQNTELMKSVDSFKIEK